MSLGPVPDINNGDWDQSQRAILGICYMTCYMPALSEANLVNCEILMPRLSLSLCVFGGGGGGEGSCR